MTFTAAEIETVFRADLRPLERDAKIAEARQRSLDGKTVTTVAALDVRAALSEYKKIEDEAKRIANLDPTVKVDADATRARDELGRFVKKSKEDLEGISDTAAKAGTDGGKRSGAGLATGIVAALATIPIAGAVVGLGKAAADAVVQGFQDGLAVEVRADTLAARTGLDEATVSRLATAAGEAYAGNFGASIDANMDTARRAIQSGLLDPESTQRDAQSVIQSLSGVADILEEDVSRVARSASRLLSNGLAKDAQGALDIIVAGQQAGLNVSEDWLDTLDEYSVQWRKLGVEGGDVLGLLSQATQAGARDTDIAADALKELSIRAIDGSKLTEQGFEAIGRNAEEMSAKFAAGGDSAREALGDTLDGLREIEDPAKRDAAAVALFGTQAEDLGKALFAMDLDTAAKGFGDLEGSAQRALDTIGDNSAGKLESAKRNIEVAANGIKGALAEAFAPQIEGAAEFVSENREAVISFLFDSANAAFDLGRALVEAAAAGTEGFGDFVGETGPAVLGVLGDIVEALASVGLVTREEADRFGEFSDNAIKNLEDFDKSTEGAADAIRKNIIENGIDPAQAKLNELGSGLINDAALSDATNRLADDIGSLGYAADGSKSELKLLNGQVDTSTEAGQRLSQQMQSVKASLEDQVAAAAKAGEGQKSLRARVSSARDAFISQVDALGLTAGEARHLADELGLIPKEVVPKVSLVDNASTKAHRIKDSIDGIQDRTVTITTIQQVLGNVPTGTGTVLRRALGGPITGPGTGTSDDVLIAASNGEHMVTDQEVRMGGGHAALYRLRAMVRAGVAKFAGGGAIGAADDQADHWWAESARWRRLARTRRTEQGREDAAEHADTAADRAREARAKARRLREEGNDVRRQIGRGEIGGDEGSIDQLISLSRDSDIAGRQRRYAGGIASSAERMLTHLDRLSNRVAKNLESAREKASELRDISNSVSSNLVGEFSLSEAVSPQSRTNRFGETTTTSPSASGAVAAVRAAATRIRAFGEKLKALARVGLKGRALSEVEELGSVVGSALADQLLADRSQLAQLNSAYAALDAAGAYAGQAVTEGYAPGGLIGADAAVRKGEAQQASLDRQYDRLGERISWAIANTLGIKPRAGGGPAAAGNAYLVNENTPNSELFVPDSNGTILNRSQMAGLAAGPSIATFTDAQVAILARAVRDGAAVGLAGHEAAQDRTAAYVGSY